MLSRPLMHHASYLSQWHRLTVVAVIFSHLVNILSLQASFRPPIRTSMSSSQALSLSVPNERVAGLWIEFLRPLNRLGWLSRSCLETARCFKRCVRLELITPMYMLCWHCAWILRQWMAAICKTGFVIFTAWKRQYTYDFATRNDCGGVLSKTVRYASCFFHALWIIYHVVTGEIPHIHPANNASLYA